MGVVWRKGLAAGGHGVLPVPPDRPGRARHLAHRGREGRGRDPAQRLRRAVHGALRADHQRSRAPRHGQSSDLHRGATGTRLRAAQGLRAARSDTHPSRPARSQASRHHRVQPHLPRDRPSHRASADLSHGALRDGWHPDRHRRAGAAQQHRRRARPLRRRRSGVRLSARRQPVGHQLAARHQRVRTAGRHRSGRVRDHGPSRRPAG